MRYPTGAKSPLELLEEFGVLVPTDERLASLPMIGDVNIFLYGSPPSTETSSNMSTVDRGEEDFYAEVEIMIAGSSTPSMKEHKLIVIQSLLFNAKD